MKSIALVVALVLLSGCAVFSAPDAPEYIQLRIDGSAAAIEPMVSAHRQYTLLVNTPRAAPGYATTQFAYFQRDREMRYYGRHEWITEPARMLQSAAVSAIERSGRFVAVVQPQSGANADLRLDLEIVALHQDFRSTRESELVMVIRAQLITGADRRVLASRVFAVREPAAADPVAGAGAADRALARILEELVGFLIDAS